ncbi:CaiB/BaiF CoA-transferase family protein [Cupriavidus pauculus]|uniref:CaiB/BaiF CoA transferase family protein n=1 Tax=Cupriavidus pauculus TaxID=82633 RepID=UPI00208939C6|nr:CaiB/BaiF CoA-transferase family protein [Cupriavidus pauculus]GJG96684.1 CoA transferase [Cupriavidus pauculus]
MSHKQAGGPLQGVKVIEFAGLGPAPFAGMLLADLGADVLLIDRPVHSAQTVPPRKNLNHRGKRSVVLNLKDVHDLARCQALCARADILLEGFRPGVMERLGLGPDVLLARHPALVYGRMTGWGQSGPMAQRAGHDINYIALSGALHAFGHDGAAPRPPLNLVGDFGGGALYLAFGVLAALLHARASGQGQVVDAAMIDGSASLLTMMQGMVAAGMWDGAPGTNLLDGGRPWYDVYATADGQWLSVGALEPQFYAELLRGTCLDATETLAMRADPKHWPTLRSRLASAIRARTRDEWTAIFAESDACVAPVLSYEEAARDAHLQARETYGIVDGVLQAMPAPRFSVTPGAIRHPPPVPGEHGESAMKDWC